MMRRKIIGKVKGWGNRQIVLGADVHWNMSKKHEALIYQYIIYLF